MSKGRTELKKHIRAAKEWLGAAEKSLDRQEDVKGDLSVMLARAELQHASETASGSVMVVWARKIVPLLVAVALAYGAVTFFNEAAKENHIEKPVSESVEKRKEKELEKINMIKPVKETDQEMKGDIREDVSEPVLDVPVRDNVQKEKLAIPDEEMQKLMCTAGQNLRSQ